MSRIADATAFTGVGERLAGVSGCEQSELRAVKASAYVIAAWFRCDCFDVRPDRSFGKRPVRNACRKDFGRGDFPLDVQDWAEDSRERNVDSEVKSGDSGTETDGWDGM
jgi:hypothetical protein